MLVVSRKQNQTVVFPNLGISVEILRIAGKAVSVGIQAPDNVRILRGELAGSLPPSLDRATEVNNATAAGLLAETPAGELTAEQSRAAHTMRNQLNKATLALHLVRKQLQAGKLQDAEQTVAATLESLAELERQAGARNAAKLVTADTNVADSTPRSGTSNKPRALLVEDNSNERELLAGYLRLSGYEVDTVEDGAAAVEFLNHQKPDVVVLDMVMPRLSGKKAVEKIRSNPAWDDIQLLVVSGSQPAEMQVPTGDRGISRWFQKPLKPDDLVQHLSAILN
jgi:carbon storage regulator CsrA